MKSTPRLLLFLLVAFPVTWTVALGTPRADRPDRDADGDGLPDFQEVHKYRTSPEKKDTAGDGIPDGDWKQRREFTYSVRTVLRVMPPYNLKAVNDDYQDARVLAETKDYVELEVVAYPLNTNADAIVANPNWQKDYAGMKEYLDPGVTTNWDAGMRQDLLRELAQDGIDPAKLTDKEVVEQVSGWLYARSKRRQMFCTHFVHFRGGKPAILPELKDYSQQQKGSKDWSDEEQFAHELLGKEMFARKTCGTCTSAAVYQATILRALGIPTRIILAIPLADSSDPQQRALVEKGLTHHQVRQTALYGLLAAGQSYASHTFLEVYVGHRWRRLNYAHLGQNILDPKYFGLMIHVHTFNDLSEANLAATWGRRYALGRRDSIFPSNNPYRALAIDDHFGRHAKVPNPPAEKEHQHLTISKVYWPEAKDVPPPVRNMLVNVKPGSGRLLVHIDEWFENAGDYVQYKLFMNRADPNFVLRAQGQAEVQAKLSMNFISGEGGKLCELELVVPPEQFAKMAKDIPYTLQPVNAVAGYSWKVKEGLTVRQALTLEEKIEDLQKKIEKLEKRLEELEKKKTDESPKGQSVSGYRRRRDNARARLSMLGRQPAGAEGGLKVVPADRPIQVEDFAGDRQARDELAPHRPRIDFVQGDTTGGHFGFSKAERAGDRQPYPLDALNQLGAVRLAQGGRFAVDGKAGQHEQRVAQPPRKVSGQNDRQLLFAGSDRFRSQIVIESRFLHGGEQIDFQG
jgi:hypothetical protein